MHQAAERLYKAARLLHVPARLCRLTGPGDPPPQGPPAARKGFHSLDLGEVERPGDPWEL
jgi:hypothetical protein